MINRLTIFSFVFVTMLMITSCTESQFSDVESPETSLSEVTLKMRADEPKLVGGVSKGANTRNASQTLITNEKKISNIWVLQYAYNESNPTSSTLVEAPRYYSLSAGATSLKLLLQTSTSQRYQIFIIANTNSSTWAADLTKGSTVATLNNKATTLSTEAAIYGNGNENLMMMGSSGPQYISSQTSVSVALTRMLAKITFTFTIPQALNLSVTSVGIYNVPNVIRCGAPGSTDIHPAVSGFSTAVYSETAVAAGTKTATYTWYVPENQKGTVSNTNANAKNDLAPQNGMYIRLYGDYKDDGNSYVFTVYPGENITNDFNIRRNYNYNVTLNINNINLSDARVDASPANCFVVSTNSMIRFDPYTRPETGGGFKYSDYVNKSVSTKTITSVKILWQTGTSSTSLALGNNSSNAYAYLKDNKIYVKTGAINGNAVIAGYNSSNQILWSWHIWVNNQKPANVANAVEYYTYYWDASGIYPSTLIKGHSFMSCNLGAENNTVGSQTAYGLYYQWGRKDPFPQASALLDHLGTTYTSANVIPVYDNAGARITWTDMTVGSSTGLFKSLVSSSTYGTIDYVTKNPTAFVCGAAVVSDGYDTNGARVNDGDWFWGHNDRLWGGSDFNTATKKYGTALANNGAIEKSIFDPCPSGWMLPPSDAFLVLSKTGLSTSSEANINMSSAFNYGYTYFVGGWKTGKTIFYPSNGEREYSGNTFRIGHCGTYFTSASSAGGAVFTFHEHPSLTDPLDNTTYKDRSMACSIRCVLINE
ncbi:DUF4906 domain-containing protein [Bacteroides graminisolvens]|uniref:DUF4906 domain-containing protein n=1 Tax=Bacteroides graminisolvens TaxID=477666 RepID=UPI0029C63602|nr:DUF4906 domain-containing protein [Bacteroides graminisolvens]